MIIRHNVDVRYNGVYVVLFIYTMNDPISPAIEVNSLCKMFGEKVAVADLSLTV